VRFERRDAAGKSISYLTNSFVGSTIPPDMIITAVQGMMEIKSGVVMGWMKGWKCLGKEWSLKGNPEAAGGVG
jgi:hypothetical protein